MFVETRNIKPKQGNCSGLLFNICFGDNKSWVGIVYFEQMDNDWISQRFEGNLQLIDQKSCT